MIKRLIYRSQLTAPLKARDIREILVKSRDNNQKVGLTGFLAHSDTHLFQLLEGDENALNQRFDIITKDPRHEHIEICHEAFHDKRLFGSWAMTFRELDPETLTQTEDAIMKISEADHDSHDAAALEFLVSHNKVVSEDRSDIDLFPYEALKNSHVVLFSQDDEFKAKLHQIFSPDKVRCLSSVLDFFIAVPRLDPDMIILDASDETDDAFEICKELRSTGEYREVPVVILSNSLLSLLEEYAFDLGANDFISKRTGQNALAARLLTHINSQNSRIELKKQNQKFTWEREEIEQTLNHQRTEFSPLSSAKFDYYLAPLDKTSGDIVLHKRVSKSKDWYLLGDFTGHGIVAAIGTPIVANIFNNHPAERPEDLLTSLNSALKAQLPVGRFMAACLVVADHDAAAFKLWNLGLPGQLLHTPQKLVEIPSTFLPLGINDNQPFAKPSYSTSGCQNASLFCYTDGLSDSIEKHSEQKSNLLSMLEPWFSMKQTDRPELESLMDFLLSLVSTPISDDVTMMTVDF